jgi:hypothetical protein
MGTIFGILCLAIIGRILLQTARGGGRSRGQNPLPILGLALLIIGYIGVFFGRLIQAAVSRQREFLADASSVQFTRNPGGITGALKKIGGLGRNRLASEPRPFEELSHMFFGNGVSEPFIGLLETHPPLTDGSASSIRISTEISPVVRYDGRDQPPEEISKPKRRRCRTFLARCLAAPFSLPVTTNAAGHQVALRFAEHRQSHAAASGIRREAAQFAARQMKTAAREPLDAVALIYAMLLSRTKRTRAAQLAGIAKRVDPAIQKDRRAVPRRFTGRRARAFAYHESRARHPPAFDAEQYRNFRKRLQWLIESNGRVELFEFVLQKIIMHHLGPQFNRPAHDGAIYSLKPLVPDCAVVLSALANVGSDDAGEIQKAFETGAPYLRAPMTTALQLLPRELRRERRLTPRSTVSRRRHRSSKKPARSLRPHRRRGRRDSGSGGRTAPRRRRHAGLPDAAVRAGGIINPPPAPRPIWRGA